MTSLDDYTAEQRLRRLLESGPTPYAPVRHDRVSHPKGWEPGVAWDGTTGTITATTPLEETPSWAVLLASWGFDPDVFEVVEPVNIRTWDAAVGNGEVKQFWYHKANVRKRLDADEAGADFDQLVAMIRKHKPAKLPVAVDTTAMIVPIADMQIGKADGGGSAASVERFIFAVDAVTRRIKDLRKIGCGLGVLVVAGMGDLVEGCTDHYAQQVFVTDLDRRQQVKIVRRLLVKAISEWAPLVGRMVVTAVPGNHGENRKDGKSFTTFGDNDDVAVMEMVAEVFAANPAAYGHVSFVIPQSELSVTLDVQGTTVAFAHGHQARSGVNPQAKVLAWWKGQAIGRKPAGDASILVTGHYHHLSVIEYGQRTHVQCPSLDGGSGWFDNVSGLGDSRPGIATFVVNGDGYIHNLHVVGMGRAAA